MRFITDKGGGLRQSFYYDPFGNLRPNSSIFDYPFTFAGQFREPENGLIFMRARHYDPELGRFIEQDPVKGDLRIPQTLNPYVYVLNNPVNLTDPSGLWTAGLCGSAQVGLAVYGTTSVCVVVTSCGEVGVTFSAGGGGSTGATAGLSPIGVQVTTGNSIEDLRGQDVFAGGSGKLLLGTTIDFSRNPDSYPKQVYGVSVDPGIGFSYTPPYFPGTELHGGSTYTWAPWSFNVGEFLQNLLP